MGARKILLIYSGGTIGMVRDYQSQSLVPFDFHNLLVQIPELEQLDCSITAMSISKPVDSSDMNPEHWKEIAEMVSRDYDFYDGFVILHGSDTMSYTASALSFMLSNLSKPVILTGSQLPIGDLRTDAKENLITAVQIASLYNDGKPVLRELGLYFEYKLYRGNRTTKTSATHFNAFSSPNFPSLIESGFELIINQPFLWRPKVRRHFRLLPQLSLDVGLLKLFPGMSRIFVTYQLSIPGMKVLVMETFGAGNASSEAWFLNSLQKAINEGLLIVNVTQCVIGGVRMGVYATSRRLKEMGVIDGKDMTTEAALTKSMWLLGQGYSGTAFTERFEQSICGELTEN